MKKINLLALLCLTIGFVSCGNSSPKNEEEKITVTGTNGKEYTSYQEACRVGDFEAAHKFLDVLHDNYIEGYGKANEYDSYQVREVREKFHAALNYIFKQEMMFLASSGDEQAADKVIYLLTEIPEEGSAYSDGRYHYQQINESYDDAKDFVTFSKWINNYNNLCNQILDLAISQENQFLAAKVVKMYKQNIITTEDPKDRNYYNVSHTWTDKNKAVEKCKEAGINL